MKLFSSYPRKLISCKT